ncbi:MAG: nucleoside transporter rane protein [Frankiales bacterium]|nr:nucleoside transporter rane protein [Frankiales bacterium]
MINRQRLRLQGVSLAIPVLSVFLALAVAAALLRASGSNPIAAYQDMISSAVGSPFALGTTLVKAVPRLLPALGIAIALRAGLWNIGAEGQLYIGALAAAGVALYGPALSFPFGAALALVAAMAAGALWGAIPGVLRAFRGINEVIISLMLVYVAIQLVNYIVEGPWLAPHSTFPATSIVANAFRLPILVPGTLVNAGLIVALVAVVVTWFLISRTSWGLRVRSVGANERGSRVLGVRVSGVVVSAMAVSGALAGLAGGVEVLGTRGRLLEGLSSNYGFEAIAIALLGRLNPLGIVAASLLFGALDAGGAGLQTAAQGTPAAIVPIVEALAVVFLLIGLGIFERMRARQLAADALRRSVVPAPADESAAESGTTGPRPPATGRRHPDADDATTALLTARKAEGP